MATTPTQSRWIDLEGAANVRDLGGLPVESGGRTASGILLRADNLQGLTRADVAQLVEGVGVGVVVDLRTGEEVRLEGPGPLVADGRVDIRHRSLHPEGGERTDVVATDELWPERPLDHPGEPQAVRIYLAYLRDRPDSIAGALHDVAHSDRAAIVHCAAGKDRTGVVCALALEAVGVPRAAVIDDYVATGERIGAILERLRSSPTYAPELDGRPDEAHLPRPETMERVLALVDEHHGGAVEWLAAHGFGDADLVALRERLVRSQVG
jgi:rhodanese-related sulfurtransferase